MIVVCPGWHRADGTQVHEQEIVLREKEPLDDPTRTHALCPECEATMKEQLQDFIASSRRRWPMQDRREEEKIGRILTWLIIILSVLFMAWQVFIR